MRFLDMVILSVIPQKLFLLCLCRLPLPAQLRALISFFFRMETFYENVNNADFFLV